MRNSVLTSGSIQHQKHLVRGAVDLFAGYALDLFQFFHQVKFILQAAGCVNNQQICFAAFLAGANRIEDYGARISARFVGDHVDAGPFPPYFELINGGGAEGIGGAQHHLAAPFAIPIRHLADASGLTGAIDTHDQHDGQKTRFINMQRFFGL